MQKIQENYQIRQINKITGSGTQGNVQFADKSFLPLPNDVAKNMSHMISLLNDDSLRAVSDALEKPQHFLKLSKYASALHQHGMLKPAEKKQTNEAVLDFINELSKPLLHRYVKSAVNNRVKHHNAAFQKHGQSSFYKEVLAEPKKAKSARDQAVRHEKKADKRDAGTKLAQTKLNRTLPDSWKTKAPEIKEEILAELKRSTLKSYIKKANIDKENNKEDAREEGLHAIHSEGPVRTGHLDAMNKHHKVRMKREAGIKRANDKLVKEEVSKNKKKPTTVKGKIWSAFKSQFAPNKIFPKLKKEEVEITEKKDSTLQKDSVRTLGGHHSTHKHHKRVHKNRKHKDFIKYVHAK